MLCLCGLCVFQIAKGFIPIFAINPIRDFNWALLSGISNSTPEFSNLIWDEDHVDAPKSLHLNSIS